MSQDPNVPGPLYQAWVHIFEEDEPGALVFRPERWGRPSAGGRGGDALRTRIELRRDGSCQVTGIGSSDLLQVCTGRFQLRAGKPFVIKVGLDEGQTIFLDVAALDEDCLLIRKS